MTTIERRTATVDIYQGDYLDRLRHLERRHDRAVEDEKDTTRLASDIPESHTIREEHAALLVEAQESAITVTLRALGRREWRALVEEHPPRKGNDEDEGAGVNEATFKDALVPKAIAGAVAGGSSVELTEDDLDGLSDGDYDRLYLIAFSLNRAPSVDPKGLRSPASQQSQGSSQN